MEWTVRGTFSAVVAVVLSVAGAGQAQDFTYGQSLFVKNCAVCHGTEGKGDGLVAELFTVKPKNLRVLASENDGAFPFSEVYQAIDGRREIKGHGNTQMPVWGGLFEADMQDRTFHPGVDVNELVQARILGLVYYLQTIQN